MLNQLKLQEISQGTHFHLEIVQYCAAEHSACTENLLPNQEYISCKERRVADLSDLNCKCSNFT